MLLTTCTFCLQATQTRVSFPLSDSMAIVSFDLVHCEFNRTTTSILYDKSPFEVLFQKFLDYSHLRVFGYLCHVHVCCIFLGYPYNKKCWTIYGLDSHEIFHSCDVIF